MLETLNVWVDTVGFLLAAGITLGVIIPYFIASVLTGRFKKHFIDDYWDSLAHRMHDPKQYHYNQPLAPDFPVPIRVWHWINIVSWMLLLVSGLYIRYPWFAGPRFGHPASVLPEYAPNRTISQPGLGTSPPSL